MTALEMGYYIGMVLAGLVRGDGQEGDVNSPGRIYVSESQRGVRAAQNVLLRIGREVS